MKPFDRWRRCGAKEWLLESRMNGPTCCLVFNADKSSLYRALAEQSGGSVSFSILGDHPCDSLATRASYVYFAITSTHIKIGQSYDVSMRISELRKAENSYGNISTPKDLVSRDIRLIGFVDGDQRDEASFHKRFGPYCVIGEWYRRDSELLAIVDAIPNLRRVWAATK